jgi:hypothetical protein
MSVSGPDCPERAGAEADQESSRQRDDHRMKGRGQVVLPVGAVRAPVEIDGGPHRSLGPAEPPPGASRRRSEGSRLSSRPDGGADTSRRAPRRGRTSRPGVPPPGVPGDRPPRSSPPRADRHPVRMHTQVSDKIAEQKHRMNAQHVLRNESGHEVSRGSNSRGGSMA